MKYSLISFTLLFFFSLLAQAGQDQDRFDTPKGFEDPKLLAKVMKGDIVLEEKISTKKEFRSIARSYFSKVSPEAYWKLATNHAKYPSMFEEVKAGKTTKVSPDALEHDYQLHLEVMVGPFSHDVYPEGHQKFTPAADMKGEALLFNEISNYKDVLKFTKQSTRLIPYENGMLVEDDVHVMLVNDSGASGMIKKKLKEFFTRYTETFRNELQGNY